MRVGLHFCGCVLATGFVACGEHVGRPLPEPPALAPIEPSLLRDDSAQQVVEPSWVALAGDPGATADGASIRVVNLNSAEIASSQPVPFPEQQDGSFQLQIQAADGDWLRFEQSVDAERSAPTDVLLALPDLLPVNRPSCIDFDGAAYASFEFGTWNARLENFCDEPITAVSATLSRAGDERLLLTSMPAVTDELALAPSDVLQLELQTLDEVLEPNVVLVVVQYRDKLIPYASVVLPEE